jgi:hypothetical protein
VKIVVVSRDAFVIILGLDLARYCDPQRFDKILAAETVVEL